MNKGATSALVFFPLVNCGKPWHKSTIRRCSPAAGTGPVDHRWFGGDPGV